jgi:hypothetical protein
MDSHTSAKPEKKRGPGKSGAKGGAYTDELATLGELWGKLPAAVRREILNLAKGGGR